jgi:outer membrane lipoprotein-sorting protein
MVVQRARRSGRARRLFAIALAGLLLADAPPPANAQQPPAPRGAPVTESFNRLYERGQRVNASIRTLTAQFEESTTSSLLVRPLIARGTLAVERPSRVVLHYTEPEPRTVLIDKNRMTISWPSPQSMDVGAAMGRIQRYFVDGTVADLRRQFDIDDRQTVEKPGTYRVLMVPKQKRIRESLDRLELWVDRETLLLASMRMTFANGDTKTMTFEHVTVNPPLPQGIFTLNR